MHSPHDRFNGRALMYDCTALRVPLHAFRHMGLKREASKQASKQSPQRLTRKEHK
jgi:hypothetical protein